MLYSPPIPSQHTIPGKFKSRKKRKYLSEKLFINDHKIKIVACIGRFLISIYSSFGVFVFSELHLYVK